MTDQQSELTFTLCAEEGSLKAMLIDYLYSHQGCIQAAAERWGIETEMVLQSEDTVEFDVRSSV
jgi:hypothetical protein